MCDKYQIDNKTRFLVLYLDAQMGAQEIATILNQPCKTVRYWISRTQNGEDIRTNTRTGRPRCMNEETEDKIIQMVKANPEGMTILKLAAITGYSRSSIGKLLRRKGYKYLGYDRSVIYDEEERAIRVEFCNHMLANEGKLIYSSFFSDEMGFQLNNARRRCWQIPPKKLRRKDKKENVKLGCWGAISAQGATSLEIYKGGMNGDFFRQVIERHKPEMETLFPDGDFYFIQDNLSAHRKSEDWLIKQQHIKLIKWPRRSPDLNIIEHLWVALKSKVRQDSPTNENELRESLLRNWELLTNPERLHMCFEALHSRYMECVSMDGQRLPG